MLEPKFQFSMKVINELTTIERLYGKINAEPLIPSLSLKLLESNQILATHHSTRIEGNPLTPLEVTNIILSDRIPTTRSETEVKNYFTALNKLAVKANKREPVTVELTLEFHHEIMRGLLLKDLGVVRNGPVFVGHKTPTEVVIKHAPPFHTKKDITYALQELFDWLGAANDLHPIIKAGILHHQFAYIHPFFDGNGRMARLLTAYYLLLNQYEVVKYFILDDYYDIDRIQYSDALHSGDFGDKTKWLEYFLEGIAYSLQAAIARIREFKHVELEDLEGEKRVLVTPRQEQVLQIVIDKKAIKTSDIVDALQVTRQQAHQLLASLVKKELLTKYGSTKTSYYKLSST